MHAGEEFYIVDQGDGWWDCPSPLRCVVLDGPGPLPESVSPDRSVSLLVQTDSAIAWKGDASYATRWGPDHPLCHPIVPTNRLIILAETRSWTLDLDGDFGVPASPVMNGADRLAEVEAVNGLGMKVSIVREPASSTTVRRMSGVEAVSGVLAALADARRAFQILGAALSARGKATNDARIHPASGEGATSYCVVHVSAIRPDGRVVTWSVSLRTGAELRIVGEVEIDADDGGTASLFLRAEPASDATHAAQLIGELTAEVAAQHHWFDEP